MRFDDPEVREFLARSMILRLAALSPKGQPIIRCLWFACQQGRIYIFTANTTPAGRSISVHPEVALLFDGEQGQRSSRILRIRGHAVFRGESEVVGRVMLGLARKYFLTRSGLRNLLAHARTVTVAVRFYAQGWREERGKGLKAIMEVLPESFEFLLGDRGEPHGRAERGEPDNHRSQDHPGELRHRRRHDDLDAPS